jgi:putative endonuclease
MMTNASHTVIYSGVSSNLVQRVFEHKGHMHPGSFTSKYNCTKLAWYQGYQDIGDAILPEKQIKGGSRADKLALINGMNPEWHDLSEQLL